MGSATRKLLAEQHLPSMGDRRMRCKTSVCYRLVKQLREYADRFISDSHQWISQISSTLRRAIGFGAAEKLRDVEVNTLLRS